MVVDDPDESLHYAMVRGCRLGLQGRAVESVEVVILRGPIRIACCMSWYSGRGDRS